MDTQVPPLTTMIVQWLQQEIEQNRLTAGSKLPTEKQLCAQFGVSRSVVREAISQLKSDGLVNSRQGLGVFVNERSARQTFRLSATVLDDKESIEHIIELLVAFESAAAQHAALRRTPDDLKKIRRALIGMEYAIAHDKPGDGEDYAFHQAICDATYNPHFIALNEYLEQHVRGLIRKARTNTVTHHQALVTAVQEEHQAIFEAIRRGDAAAAAHAAQTHLQNAARRLDIYLKN